MNSTAKVPNSTANGTKSTAKVTNSIAKTCKDSFELLCSHFRDPLEATDVSITSMQDEIEDALMYARSYLGT